MCALAFALACNICTTTILLGVCAYPAPCDVIDAFFFYMALAGALVFLFVSLVLLLQVQRRS